MPVPFKVKAVYEYRSEEPDDLNFDNGQIITVIEEDDADWYTGEYTTADGVKKDGIFPRNFVEKYEPAIPSRPVRAPRKVPQPDPEPEPAQEIPSVTAFPPPAHEPSREAEIEPPREISQPVPDPAPAPKPVRDPSPPPQVEKSTPAKKAPPPVVEKPSSFRDRIAAFNKPAAAPVAPFKPAAAGGAGFIKKPYVAPPPSRNAYVPPQRDLPPPKVYRREEEMENERERAEPEEPPRQIALTSESTQDEEDQPKPTSLKDRIALLQQQQLEQAQRQANPITKKEKPKRPAKPRTESQEAPSETATVDDGSTLERVSTERAHRDPEPFEERPLSRKSTEVHSIVTQPPLPTPSRELVSDTNDADDSGAADTEDSHDISTEEERPKSRSIKSPQMAAQPEPTVEEEEDDEDETEEEEDPEVRRKRELRERMAKMSGGMGMMGMFGAGAAPQPSRAKSTRQKVQRDPEPEEQEEPQRAPPVPIMPGMALPGMARPAQPAAKDSDDEYATAEPTPIPTQDDPAQEDYIAHRLSRRSTNQALPSQDRAPPPPPPDDRPEPPQSPGARPVPPPPPPTQYETLPLARDFDDDDNEIPRSPPASAPRPPNVPARAVPPPPPPVQTQTQDAPRAVPPVPMSPTSPPSRLPPPPPPGPPSRRVTSDSLQPVPREDSEDEVTEYDGDCDTDIAPTAKHKAALRSHTRDSSIEEDTFSDDSVRNAQSSQPRAAPPPLPPTTPRDLPPAPPQTNTRPRESVDSPRAPPPPVPQSSAPRPRESVDSPRAAPPPIPPTRSPVDEEEDYDPYRNSAYQPSLPNMMASMRRKTGDFESDYTDTSPVSHHAPPHPSDRAAAPLPPTFQQAPPPPPSFQQPLPPPSFQQPPPPPPTFQTPPPPVERAPTFQDTESVPIASGGLTAPRQSTDAPQGLGLGLGRSNTRSRRSADVVRPQNDEFIASDIDLAPNSQWYTHENTPPPSLRNRPDVLWEVESSSTTKRGGRQSVSRDVYVLYQDYSQTTVNATYDASEPTHVSFEQNHERPPPPPRKDQLESASEQFGNAIARAAEKSAGITIGEGSASEFVYSLIRPLKAALLPVGSRSYGALVYANLANASTQQFDEIRAGDIITFRNAKFAGHKGGLHTKYIQEAGIGREHVGVVIDWDGTKKKIRVWEQGNQEKGKKSKIRDESYRVGDLKSGEVRVFRVMPRSWVSWGTN